MKTISIDIETYSGTDLGKCGVYKYTEDPDFEVLLFGYAVDGGEVHVVDLALGEKIPADIAASLTDENVLKFAFNANFERVCLSRHLGMPTGEYLDPSSWRCTMVWAAYMGLPLSLQGVGTVLNLDKQKLTEGKELIKYFCSPCAPTKSNGGRTRNRPEDAPEKWSLFKSYNLRDVETEMGIQQKLTKFPVPELVWDEYHIDQEINDRGVRLDIPLVDTAIRMDAASRQELMDDMRRITELENPNSVTQMRSWLADNGLETDTLGKKAVNEMLKTAPPELADALVLRQQLAKSSVKKYQAMQKAVCSDGRARGMFQFYGANRTGRWAGRLIQMQNLPQNHLSDLAEARGLVRSGNYEAVKMLYVNNARTHSPEQINKLRSSLREFGFINPVIIDRDFSVIAGHGRILAAKEEGITEVPCVFADHLTDAQKKAYIIADNRMAMDAGWDEELLRVEIEALQAEDFDLALTGFDEKELSKLFDDGTEGEEDDFDVTAELEKPVFSKPGDVWTLGRHRLVCGDSTKPETYEVLMEGKKANLVLTDPPYNVNYKGSAGTIQNDNWSDGEAFYHFLLDAFTNTEKVMANDASIYVFHADTEGLNFRKAFSDAGFYLSGCCIWKKPSLVLGHSPYQWQHEPCLFGWKRNGKHQWYADRKQTTIWEFEKSKKNGEHPTMKPIPLLCYPIMNSSMSNTLVLDPFGGSGSTLIACEQTDRSCNTIELDPKFCDVIVNRYIEQVGTNENVSVLRDGKIYQYGEVTANE